MRTPARRFNHKRASSSHCHTTHVHLHRNPMSRNKTVKSSQHVITPSGPLPIHINTRTHPRVSRARQIEISSRYPRIDVGLQTEVDKSSRHVLGPSGPAHTYHHGSPAVSGTETDRPSYTALRRSMCPLNARQHTRVSPEASRPPRGTVPLNPRNCLELEKYSLMAV